jgi:hypothetical protein
MDHFTFGILERGEVSSHGTKRLIKYSTIDRYRYFKSLIPNFCHSSAPPSRTAFRYMRHEATDVAGELLLLDHLTGVSIHLGADVQLHVRPASNKKCTYTTSLSNVHNSTSSNHGTRTVEQREGEFFVTVQCLRCCSASGWGGFPGASSSSARERTSSRSRTCRCARRWT